MSELRIGVRWSREGADHVLTDLFGVRAPAVLDGVGRKVARALLAGTNECDISAAEGIDVDDVAQLRQQLALHGLFEGPDARAERELAFSHHVAGGTLFLAPPRAPALELAIAEDAIARARQVLARRGPLRVDRTMRGALVPHGALEATGACAALAITLLGPERFPDVVAIVGTSHYLRDAPAMLTLDVSTPFGRVESDRLLGELVRRDFASRFVIDDPVFLIEHSWQQPLALVSLLAREYGRTPKILALLTGSLTLDEGRALGRLLSEICFEQRTRACLIASGDLSHFGDGYEWRAPFLDGALSAREVGGRLAAFEKGLLDAIAAGDHDAFCAGVDATSFCARAQVAALTAMAPGKGRILGRQSVFCWRPVRTLPSREWRETDCIFNAAAIAISETAFEGGSLRLCSDVLFVLRDGQCELFHRCDNRSYALAAVAYPIVLEMQRGTSSPRALARALRSWGLEVAPGELGELIAEWREMGWLHAFEAPSRLPATSLYDRADAVLERAVREVPYYAAMNGTRASGAPLLFPRTVKSVGRALVAHDAVDDPARMLRRESSATTDRIGVVTYRERQLWEERSVAFLVVSEIDPAWVKAHINRAHNLGLEEPASGWPALRTSWGTREMPPGTVALSPNGITPGPNASDVSAQVWDRCIEHLLALEPEVLEGDPATIAGLARRCSMLGVRLPRLRLIEVGHNFPWSIHRSAIDRAFGVPIRSTLITSEVDDVAVSCRRGHLHLLETHLLCEVFASPNRQAELDELGVLVVTTLDDRVMPLVRYVLGDLVRVTAPRCECGRPFRTIRYEGRLRHLVRGRGGEWLTYQRIDELVGAPAGLSFFRITVHDDEHATLTLVPSGARELVDAQRITELLSHALARRIAVEWAPRLELAYPTGKLHLVETPDRTDEWYALFLGSTPPG